MRYTDIDGVRVSKIVFGTTYLGSDIPDEQSFELMDTYLRLGGNCLDTARAYNLYVGAYGVDQSERCLGLYMEARKNREQIVLSTKGGHHTGEGTRPRLDRPTLTADFERSLELLRTDHVDIYWLHRDDLERPVGEMLESVEDFLERGWTRTVGASNWTVERMEEARVYAETHGLHGFSAAQIQWSLAVTEPERLNDSTLVCMRSHEMDWFAPKHFPIFAFSAQAKGFFSKYLAGDELNPKLRRRYDTPENRALAEKVRVVADKHGINPTAVALHFVLDNRLPACGIVGCTSVRQMEDTLSSADFILPPEDVRFLRTL